MAENSHDSQTDVVAGAFGYSGAAIARDLLAAGDPGALRSPATLAERLPGPRRRTPP